MALTRPEQLFLEALSAAVQEKTVSWAEDVSVSELADVMKLAEQHQVIPMIFQAIYSCPAAQKAGPQFLAPYKRSTVQLVTLQTMKTAQFLDLYRYLRNAGIRACVVKGIVCRSLYLRPDDRISGDEDLLIPAEQFPLCHQAMLDYGMVLSDPNQDLSASHEVAYGKPGSPLYIEVHKSLFPPDSEAYGDFNRFFRGVFDRLAEFPVMDTAVLTLDSTDHFFYLILHAFKHFLHSGFGIRQVCDIVLYANAYGTQMDWLKLLENCREIHADLFAAALFQIGRKYLTFDPDKACYPPQWRDLLVDEEAMLKDLLASGVYGASDMSRKHSSNITLNAVSAQKQGKQGRSRVLKTLFPPAKALERRYPYLKEKPYLLPAAWASRIVQYGKETRNSANGGNNAADAIKIGNARVELMKQYGILNCQKE